MRVFFLLARRVPPVPSPVLIEACALLEDRGFEVESAIVDELVLRPDRLAAGHDLYVLKSHTELSLSVAGVLAGQGARLLNPYLSCLATQDKIVASRLLRMAGVPTPRTWITGDLSLLRPLVEEGPLVLKPHRGHRGMGIAVVQTEAELAALPPPQTPMLVQERIEGDGEDVKIYVVGDHVFAVRKPFSAMSFTQPGRPFVVGLELRDLALACGRALGLGLYGLDVIHGAAGPVVVDVNTFPGYKGVPGAAPLIADYIEAYSYERTRLEPPAVGPAVVGAELVT